MGVKDAPFELVPTDEVPEYGWSARGRQPTKLALALEAGNVVFWPYAKPSAASSLRSGQRSYLAGKGYGVHTLEGERNGVPGLFLRAVKKEPQP